MASAGLSLAYRMTDEQAQKLDELHEFFFGKTPGLADEKTRAQQLEDILRAYRAGSLLLRLFLLFSGVVAAVAVVANSFKGGGS